jgi:hypothetical protein
MPMATPAIVQGAILVQEARPRQAEVSPGAWSSITQRLGAALRRPRLHNGHDFVLLHQPAMHLVPAHRGHAGPDTDVAASFLVRDLYARKLP